MAKPLPLTLGLSVNNRTQALFDGQVQPEGIDLECRSQFSEGYDNTGARHRWIIATAGSLRAGSPVGNARRLRLFWLVTVECR